MKPNIFLQSTFRRPLQMLLLILLLGLAAFGFISSAAEYLSVQTETGRLGEYYQSVGMLVPKNGEETDVTAGVELLSGNEHIAYSDWRRVVTGLLPEGMVNVDIDGVYTYEASPGQPLTNLNDVLFYGTLEKKTIDGFPGYPVNDDLLHFKVDTVLQGRSEHINPDVQVYVYAPRPEFIPVHKPGKNLWDAIVAPKITITPELLAEYPFLGMEAGGRYLVRAQHRWGRLYTTPLQTDGPAFLPVPDGTTVNLESGEFEQLQEALHLQRVNQRCMTVVATHDMHALPTRWEGARQLSLAEGRWLDAKDDDARSSVCMLYADFAEKHGISLGDTISLKALDNRKVFQPSMGTDEDDLYTFTQYAGYFFDTDGSPDLTGPNLELEVVGTFAIRSKYETTSDRNMIYIPQSVLPAELGGETRTATNKDMFSFVLRSYQDVDPFVQETRAPLDALGLRVAFIDNNAQVFWGIMAPLAEAKLLSLVLYSLLLVLALALVTFLYLRPRRKEFAILRALGLPRGKALGELHLPIALLGIVGGGIGGFLGWNYALGQAAEAMSGVHELAGAFAPPSSALFALFFLGIFALLMLFVFVSAAQMARRSVLTLLHGGGNAPRRRT